MQKEFEKQEKLKALSEEERKKYEEELKAQQQKHNKHEPLHHPGNKAQLEEGLLQQEIQTNVWCLIEIFHFLLSHFQCGRSKIIWMRLISIRKHFS